MKRLAAIVVFDIDGVVRDVSGSYRRALADTVERFTQNAYRPTSQEIDLLKSEGAWNNDWEASQELVYRYFEAQGTLRSSIDLNYQELVTFFQSKYRGTDSEHWTGYICAEPLLLEPAYLDSLTQSGIRWGFFSGATRASANYVLEKRLGLQSPVLIAMEDAPGKPNPAGLLDSVQRLENEPEQMTPVIYVGDTVADMVTIERSRTLQPDRIWIAVGVLPPHVQQNAEQTHYVNTLFQAGADVVLNNVQELTPEKVFELTRL
ncbi:TIGR01548 family HAD-type hydrolase [Phormidesmis priestleyi ULC007]|uniref:TIGR01548 family HAD-type hydrolase n=1 Tax=Phormidesmis priestleyi ULC007 TaxID=1920490 RepID=A0A2T1DC56_9CYAN|nr:TIGR01548 family HAD-type hydrolase [Phormidesmis priestleyi ULC007]PZO49394.1 MAG: TIGR01548 family HAD-type hydrolase [Phormidesmis priestleyi]